MNLQNLHTNLTSDAMLLTSTADYFESKIEKSVALVNDISEVIQHIDDEEYVLPEFDYTINVEVDGVMYFLVSTDFWQALLQGEAELIHIDEQGREILVKIEDVIDQLKDSILVNRVMIESLYTLRDCASDNISEITAAFIARLQLVVGEVTETASSLGTKFLSVLTQTGVSVGDRLRNLLSFIGIYNVNESNPPIGTPKSDLTDITGISAFGAWVNGFPDTIFGWVFWLGKAVKAIIDAFKAVVQVVVGSSVYRTLTKFVKTLTTQADSFAFNNSVEDSDIIDSHGFSFKIKGLSYSQYWVSQPNDTIRGVLINLHNACYSSGQDVSGMTVYDLAVSVYSSLIYGPQNGSPMALFLSDNPDRVPHQTPIDAEEYQIAYYVNYIYNRLALQYYHYIDLSNNVSILSMLNYSIGSLLDFLKINSLSNVTKHLYSTQYLSFDLPCSSIYIWLVGDDIYVTRRVSPCTRYREFDNFTDIRNDILDKFKYVRGPHPRPGYNDPTYYIDAQAFSSFITSLRSNNNVYVDSDLEMINSIYAANVIDTLYLRVLYGVFTSGGTFSTEFSRFGLYGSDDFQFFDILTGRTHDAFVLTFDNLASGSISNLILAEALGADVSIPTYQLNDFKVFPYLSIIEAFTNSNVFIPYKQVGKIDSGRYHVITDYELRHLFSVTIRVLTVVLATTFILIKMGQLKRKALAMRTKADSVAWDQVLKDEYDDKAIKNQYKMYKRASLCEKCAQAVFGGVSRVVQSTASGIKNAVSSVVGNIKRLLSGTNNNTDEQYSMRDIILAIFGHDFPE